MYVHVHFVSCSVHDLHLFCMRVCRGQRTDTTNIRCALIRVGRHPLPRRFVATDYNRHCDFNKYSSTLRDDVSIRDHSGCFLFGRGLRLQ